MEFSRAFSVSRSLSDAWKILFRAPASLLLAGVLLWLLSSPGSPSWGIRYHDHWRHAEWLLPLVSLIGLFGCFLGVLFFLAKCWIWVGFANAIESTARAGDESLARIFDAKDRWLAMALARLLWGACLLLLLVPFAVPVGLGVFTHRVLEAPEPAAVAVGIAAGLVWLPVPVYVLLGLALVKPVVALEGLDPFAAFARSWSLARGHRLRLLWFFVALEVLTLSGLCLCLIGVMFTWTLTRVAWIDAYLALTRGGERERWWVSGGLPAAAAPAPPPLAG
jgi:hypothetical protein